MSEHECPKCGCDFEVTFTDCLLDREVPEVKFCPNCGYDNIFDK
ncbi:hypothetical protein [Priestia megaterium]|nr:hypothetical protein [Priestia megaterium]